MQFLRYFLVKPFLALLAFITFFGVVGPLQAQEEPHLLPPTHESRIERSDTDPTYIMDDSPKRRQIQAKVNEERLQAKYEAKLEALQAKELKSHTPSKTEQSEEPEAPPKTEQK